MRTLVSTFLPFHSEDTRNGERRYNTGTPHKTYDYLYAGHRDVKPGDWALVHNGHEFGLVRIERVKPGFSEKATKHVLTVITKGDFEQYQAANKAIMERVQIYDELEHLLKQESKLERYQRLAENNPAAKELLDRLNVYEGPMIESSETKPTFTADPAKQAAESVMETLRPDTEVDLQDSPSGPINGWLGDGPAHEEEMPGIGFKYSL